MTITVEAMKELAPDGCQIIDIRSEMELSYGKIPGAVHIKQDALYGNEYIDRSGKPVIICCSRGEFSVEASEKLREEGEIKAA